MPCNPENFPPIIKGGAVNVSIDFTDFLGAGEVVTGGAITCSVVEGTDPSPQDMVSGPAQVASDGATLIQLIDTTAAGVAGVSYRLLFLATTPTQPAIPYEALIDVVATELP